MEVKAGGAKPEPPSGLTPIPWAAMCVGDRGCRLREDHRAHYSHSPACGIPPRRARAHPRVLHNGRDGLAESPCLTRRRHPKRLRRLGRQVSSPRIMSSLHVHGSLLGQMCIAPLLRGRIAPSSRRTCSGSLLRVGQCKGTGSSRNHRQRGFAQRRSTACRGTRQVAFGCRGRIHRVSR